MMEHMTLPDAETLKSSLATVHDDPHAIERLYPEIARYAGQECVGPGIVLMLQMALFDYCRDMPSPIYWMLCDYMPDWIEAITNSNDAVKADALAHWTLISERP